jgi:hypothetical protein
MDIYANVSRLKPRPTTTGLIINGLIDKGLTNDG